MDRLFDRIEDPAMGTPLVRALDRPSLTADRETLNVGMSRTKLHSTNPIERLNKEVKRRSDVVGIFPNDASIMRLIGPRHGRSDQWRNHGSMQFEQNDEWQTTNCYKMVEAFAQIDKEEIDPILSMTTKAA